MFNEVRDQLVKLRFCNVENPGRKNTDESTDFENLEMNVFQLPKNMTKLKFLKNDLADIFRCDDLLQNTRVLNTLVIGKAFKRSKRVEETLQNICNAKTILTSVTNLEICEVHDPKLVEGLKATFPNLVRLKVDSFYGTDFNGDESGMELGVVLKACEGWKGLKHLNLALPTYPVQILDILHALLDVEELYTRESPFN